MIRRIVDTIIRASIKPSVRREDFIKKYVQMSALERKEWFGEVDCFKVPVLLWTPYIELHIKVIFPKKSKIVVAICISWSPYRRAASQDILDELETRTSILNQSQAALYVRYASQTISIIYRFCSYDQNCTWGRSPQSQKSTYSVPSRKRFPMYGTWPSTTERYRNPVLDFRYNLSTLTTLVQNDV